MTQVRTNFCEVLTFPLGFIGFWVHFVMPPFVNDPVIAKQMTNLNFFLIIIDLESPKNCPRLVWFRSGKKPGTSSQN